LSNGFEEPIPIALMLVLLFPQPSRSLQHNSIIRSARIARITNAIIEHRTWAELEWSIVIVTGLTPLASGVPLSLDPFISPAV
jgi:hypothetical protein